MKTDEEQSYSSAYSYVMLISMHSPSWNLLWDLKACEDWGPRIKKQRRGRGGRGGGKGRGWGWEVKRKAQRRVNLSRRKTRVEVTLGNHSPSYYHIAGTPTKWPSSHRYSRMWIISTVCFYCIPFICHYTFLKYIIQPYGIIHPITH